jgi:lysozyme family protein
VTPFLQAWSKTGRIEAGYSNHPSDAGGETMYGITARVARAHGYTGPMLDLPYPLALTIAKTEFWDTLRLDEIHALSPAIAGKLFDINLNMWYGAAAKFLQRSLNALNRQGKDYPDLVVDGRIGTKSVDAIKALLRVRGPAGKAVLYASLEAMQIADWHRQTEDNVLKEDFYFGWVWKRVCEETLLPEDRR